MISPRSPENVLATFTRLETNSSNSLLAFDSELYRTIQSLIAQLREVPSSDKSRVVRTILRTLEAYPKIDTNIRWELQFQTTMAQTLLNWTRDQGFSLSDSNSVAAVSVLRWKLVSTNLPSLDDLVEKRYITIRDEGRNAVIINLENLTLDIDELATISAALLIAGKDILNDPQHPLAIIIAVLIAIAMFTNAMKKEFTEDEATVFWAFIHVCNPARTASEAQITDMANQFRQTYAGQILHPEEVRRHLYSLQLMHAVKLLDIDQGYWQIHEQYRIVR